MVPGVDDAGRGPDAPSAGPARHPARLAARRGDGPLVTITLDPPGDARATHTTPGQYVSIAAAGDEGYFVLASPVGAPAWSLLVRRGGTVADALLDAPIGTVFPTSAALGSGFSCHDARGRRLVMLAAGTGIAAAPPVLAGRIAEGDAALTDVFLGLRSVTELPFPEELDAWRAAGARVTVCVSREPARGAGVARGYVQDVARAALSSAHGGLLFAVGPDKMVDCARDLGKSLGMAESDVRTNY